MNKSLLLVPVATVFAAFATPSATAADTLVSNLGQPWFGSLDITRSSGDWPDYYAAVSFTTGPSRSTVTGAWAHLGNWSPSGNIFDAIYEASIWNDASGLPGSQLATFDNNPTLAAGEPNFENTTSIIFADSGINLEANTTYWFAVRNTGSGVGDFDLHWALTPSDLEDPPPSWIFPPPPPSGWTISNGSGADTSSGSWDTLLTADETSKFSLEGTVVPEPRSLGVLFVGGILTFALMRWRKARRA